MKDTDDVNNIVKSNNCILIDKKCYDPVKGELQATAYVDLQPAP